MGFRRRSVELLFVFWVVLWPFCLGIQSINSRLSVGGGDGFGFGVYGATEFVEVPQYRNGSDCPAIKPYASLCDPSFVHIAMTLDLEYLRGSLAAVYSINHHASCPEKHLLPFHRGRVRPGQSTASESNSPIDLPVAQIESSYLQRRQGD
ncbi:hypothetical protein SLA2020_343360 [Shorea laevis]